MIATASVSQAFTLPHEGGVERSLWGSKARAPAASRVVNRSSCRARPRDRPTKRPSTRHRHLSSYHPDVAPGVFPALPEPISKSTHASATLDCGRLRGCGMSLWMWTHCTVTVGRSPTCAVPAESSTTGVQSQSVRTASCGQSESSSIKCKACPKNATQRRDKHVAAATAPRDPPSIPPTLRLPAFSNRLNGARSHCVRARTVS
ncbi:hypothetical protein BKA93DRAFT_54856 [Sparassis latifolia]